MRCVGTVSRGIRTGVIKNGDNLEILLLILFLELA